MFWFLNKCADKQTTLATVQLCVATAQLEKSYFRQHKHILDTITVKDRRNAEMVRIVAIRTFNPKKPSTGTIAVVNGEEYFLMGGYLETTFLCNKRQNLPFSKCAVPRYAPAELFAFVEPIGSDVEGVRSEMTKITGKGKSSCNLKPSKIGKGSKEDAWALHRSNPGRKNERNGTDWITAGRKCVRKHVMEDIDVVTSSCAPSPASKTLDAVLYN
ncbi:hypothetical protein BJ742DRAFT_807845 [Cladochytrium replicatum]|nr:hypothetical protein BJ742DRAFT_807845 [Cladochytrium replicatum]